MIYKKPKSKFFIFFDWASVVLVVFGLAYVLFSKGGLFGGY